MNDRTQEEMFPAGSWKDVSLQDCLEEVRREINVRKRVYPRWVEHKKLNVVTADRRIIMMQRIEKELEALLR